MSYSTGEIAELCGVTVRTVQFYDRENLLKPDGISEGGRRLYSENSLKTLQIICIYRDLGLSLSEIKRVLSDEENSRKILISVLEERERVLDGELEEKLSQRNSVRIIKEYLATGEAISRNSFIDVQKIMNGKKRLRAVHIWTLVLGALMTASEITAIVLWAVMGLWIPFAAVMPVAIAICCALTAALYKNTAYICVDCGKKFQPKFWEFFFSPHTPKTRKCTCSYCGKKNYHTETYQD